MDLEEADDLQEEIGMMRVVTRRRIACLIWTARKAVIKIRQHSAFTQEDERLVKVIVVS